MTSNAENIKNFLYKLENIKHPCKQIYSFAFEVEGIDFYKIFDRLENSENQYFYSATPNESVKFLGFDFILNISQLGGNRVEATAQKIRELELNQVSNFSQWGLKSVPLFLGGMKFSPESEGNLWNDFSDSEWFVPKLLLYKSELKNYVIYNFFVDELTIKEFEEYDSLLNFILSEEIKDNFNEECSIIETNFGSPEEKLKWMDQVTSALEQIRAGRFHKIVLSRMVETELNCIPRFGKISMELERLYPKCYIFVFKKNKSTFFGASPEKLAKISGGWVEADALAGSIARGADADEDKQLESELLSSIKNINEQKAVVEFIVNSFTDFSEEIQYEQAPIIRKLPNIQHLWTPIRAKLKANKSVLSILKDIHPTPAICGVPWTNALVSIKEMETHSRGLFAGMVGWFNFENEGEFAVAIRSALAKGKNIYAFAGCGIVEGSDPELEFKEAELKLRPILTLFKNEEIYQS